MEIDIRDHIVQKVTGIRFSQNRTASGYRQASVLRGGANEADIVEDDNGNFVRINGKQHALNLIKALEKAIELGWFE